jgi:hypothetical protein
MSAYSETQTTFKDAELLIAALLEMGISEVRNHVSNPVTLEDWHGNKRPEKADIVIPRRAVGSAANDIGFVKGADGTYGAIISKHDATSNRYDGAWLRKLKATYADKGIMRTAARKGLRFVSKKNVTVGGKLKTEYEFIKA